MCVDMGALIVTLLYFTTGMVFNHFFVDFDNGEKFSIWLMLLWPIVVILYIGTWLFIGLPWRLKRWFIDKFKGA